MNPSISIVIPNYNGRKLLQENLPALYRALETSSVNDFEVIISDDASIDDSVTFLNVYYPSVIVITSASNVGFAGNINKGIFKAQKELVLLLNNDVCLTAGYFKPQLNYFKNPNTFGVMGKIVGPADGKIQDTAKFPAYRFAKINTTQNYLSQSDGHLPSFFLSGANALVDRKKLMELNGFQELFNPFYYEDVDLGLRAWRLGYTCYYEPKAVCTHPLSATINKEPSSRVKVAVKQNKMLLHYLHLDTIETYYFLTITFFNTIFRFLIGDKNYVKAYMNMAQFTSKF